MALSEKKPRRRITAGQRFGRLVAVRPASQAGGFWECRCDCGAATTPRACELNRGNVVSCGCFNRDRRRSRNGEGWVSMVIGRYRHGAAARDYAWALSYEQAKSLFMSACFYCGAPPAQRLAPRVIAGAPSYAAVRYTGIDRVDNSRGYETDNVVPCCGTCNRAKRVMSVSEFIAWARRVVSRADAVREASA